MICLHVAAKVIGYFAYASPTVVVCTGEACVISGSRRAMEEYILEMDPEGGERHTIKKTTFDEIMRGLLLGAAYAFDKRSYKRFYPLARQGGLVVEAADFEQHQAAGERFFTVQLKKQFRGQGREEKGLLKAEYVKNYVLRLWFEEDSV